MLWYSREKGQRDCGGNNRGNKDGAEHVRSNEAVEKVVEGSGEGDFWGGQTIPEDVIV